MIPERDELDEALNDAARYFGPYGPAWMDAEIAAENAAREDRDRFEGGYGEEGKS